MLNLTEMVITEEELIRKAQAGDRKAYCSLVSLLQDQVVNMVYRFCGQMDLAEDAAQDAFIRAWDKLESYQPRASFRSWVYRIAINRTLDLLRREKETVDIHALPIASRQDGPVKEVESKELSETIQQAILSLPDASRAAVILREYEGLSYQEISEVLEIPLGTVMSRLNYARKMLREKLSEYMEEA